MEPTAPRILTINAGSSSVKFALFGVDGTVIERGVTETAAGHEAAAKFIFDWLAARLGGATPAAIGYRVVHGGPKYSEPALITDEVLRDLAAITPFDPEHLPEEMHLIEALRKQFPGVPHVACFDTAFHNDMPRVAHILPIPRKYGAQGVRRYGFHGLSYSFLMEELARVAGTDAAAGRVVLAHLGSGASLCAVRGGTSVDTTMAFTPTAGIPMSTRSGDLDPGLAFYFARTEGMTPQQFNKMVDFESGLLGISETTADMHALILNSDNDPRAAEAVAVFCYEVKKRIGAFAAAMGGIDTIVFAGGIGEAAPKIRARVCEGLEFLGVALDAAKNDAGEALISATAGKVAVRVMHTDEEAMIARAVSRLLKTN